MSSASIGCRHTLDTRCMVMIRRSTMNSEKGIQILIRIYVFSCFLLQIQSFLTLQSLVALRFKSLLQVEVCVCVCVCV